MKQTDSVIEGLRLLLYGDWSVSPILQRYQHTDEQLFEALWQIPPSPKHYLNISDEIGQRWRQLFNGKLPKKWESPFYALPHNDPEPFHPLCRFYRSVIFTEGRMIILLTLQWVQSLELTLLKYELVTLQQGLISLLQECDNRFREHSFRDDNQETHLEAYLLKLLHRQLLMFLQELGDRYNHLLEDRAVTSEELYLKWLHRPVQEDYRWYHTEAYYDFHLEKGLRAAGDAPLDRIENLLLQAYGEENRLSVRQDKQKVRKCIYRLENVLLCYVTAVETEQLASYDLLDYKENARRIADWIAMLDDFKHKDESFSLDHLLRRVFYCRDIIRFADGNSHAAQLLRRLEGIFDSSSADEMPEEADTRNEKANKSSETEEHWALQQYVPLKVIREKLGVHSKTLNKYIKESQVDIVVFSQKSKWMHQDDFHEFMNVHKEKL